MSGGATFILGLDQAEGTSGWSFVRRESGTIDVIDSGLVTHADERSTTVRWCFRKALEGNQARPLLVVLERHTFGPKQVLAGLHCGRGRWLQCVEEAAISYGAQFRLRYYMPAFWRGQLSLAKREGEDGWKLAAREYAAGVLGKELVELGPDQAEGVCIGIAAALTEKDPKLRRKAAA